jgi:hypothetical protein
MVDVRGKTHNSNFGRRLGVPNRGDGGDGDCGGKGRTCWEGEPSSVDAEEKSDGVAEPASSTWCQPEPAGGAEGSNRATSPDLGLRITTIASRFGLVRGPVASGERGRLHILTWWPSR